MKIRAKSGAAVLLCSLGLQGCGGGAAAESPAAHDDELESANANWEQSRFTARHSANNPYETALTAATVAPAHVVYQVAVPGTALASSSSNLVPGDTSGASDVFVRDRNMSTTERDSVGRP